MNHSILGKTANWKTVPTVLTPKMRQAMLDVVASLHADVRGVSPDVLYSAALDHAPIQGQQYVMEIVVSGRKTFTAKAAPGSGPQRAGIAGIKASSVESPDAAVRALLARSPRPLDIDDALIRQFQPLPGEHTLRFGVCIEEFSGVAS